MAPKEAIQFGHMLDRLLREILLADQSHEPPEMMKVDIADGFYRIQLNVGDIPKLGVVFPTRDSKEPLVAFPLVLPMGWVNSPPAFCAATETSADLANAQIRHSGEPEPHVFDTMAQAQDDESSSRRKPSPEIPQIPRDPCLPSGGCWKPLQYVYVSIDNFLALAQGQLSRH